jgi:hypothetical protein
LRPGVSRASLVAALVGELATDEAFHQPPALGQPPMYLGLFIQFLREGCGPPDRPPGRPGIRIA